MAPLLESIHAGRVLAVQILEVAKFVVVHQVGDHHSNVLSTDSVTNVLAVSTTVVLSVNRC